MEQNNYHDELNKQNIRKLREILATLPPFCKQFFRGVDNIYGSRTKIAYAYDLGTFFHFLHEENAYCSTMEIRSFPLTLLDQITVTDLEEYMSYLRYYIKDGKEYTNDERGIMRKVATLKSFYNYFFRKEKIEKNPAALVQLPKRHDKTIIRFDPDEVAMFPASGTRTPYLEAISLVISPTIGICI